MSTEALDIREFEVWFDSLYVAGHAFAFPCDHHGAVDLDALTDRQRRSYLYVRAMVGHDFATPRVTRAPR